MCVYNNEEFVRLFQVEAHLGQIIKPRIAGHPHHRLLIPTLLPHLNAQPPPRHQNQLSLVAHHDRQLSLNRSILRAIAQQDLRGTEDQEHQGVLGAEGRTGDETGADAGDAEGLEDGGRAEWTVV